MYNRIITFKFDLIKTIFKDNYVSLKEDKKIKEAAEKIDFNKLFTDIGNQEVDQTQKEKIHDYYSGFSEKEPSDPPNSNKITYYKYINWNYNRNNLRTVLKVFNCLVPLFVFCKENIKYYEFCEYLKENHFDLVRYLNSVLIDFSFEFGIVNSYNPLDLRYVDVESLLKELKKYDNNLSLYLAMPGVKCELETINREWGRVNKKNYPNKREFTRIIEVPTLDNVTKDFKQIENCIKGFYYHLESLDKAIVCLHL